MQYRCGKEPEEHVRVGFRPDSDEAGVAEDGLSYAVEGIAHQGQVASCLEVAALNIRGEVEGLADVSPVKGALIVFEKRI